MLNTLAKNHLSWNIPTVCPICGHALEINENMTRIICPNEACEQKLVARITTWARIHKIKEWAPKTIQVLLDNNLVKKISDVWSMDYSKIAEIDGFGEKSAKTLEKNMKKVSKTSLQKFITGFNIMDIGASQSKKMLEAAGVHNLEQLEEKISDVNNFITAGIGEKTAQKFVEGCSELMEDMKEMNKYVSIEEEVVKAPSSSKLGGKSFCFTGAASRPRKELQAMVLDNGGQVFDGVKKGLDYLVIADPNSTSSKAVKARKAGITLISEEDFVKMTK